jgi:hypothetical protein
MASWRKIQHRQQEEAERGHGQQRRLQTVEEACSMGGALYDLLNFCCTSVAMQGEM